MNLSPRAQLAIGIALAALMAMTRGQHFASVDNLPSASWAVFFLAGVYLRPRWVFPALFIETSLLDFGSLASGTVSDWCLSPAYWLLVPAYATLWFAGRLFAARQRGPAQSGALLLASMVVGALVAHLISSGGFYFFSGRYPEPTFAVFLERIGYYYPRYLGNLALYVAIAAILHSGVASFLKLQQPDEAKP